MVFWTEMEKQKVQIDRLNPNLYSFEVLTAGSEQQHLHSMTFLRSIMI